MANVWETEKCGESECNQVCIALTAFHSHEGIQRGRIVAPALLYSGRKSKDIEYGTILELYTITRGLRFRANAPATCTHVTKSVCNIRRCRESPINMKAQDVSSAIWAHRGV